MIEIIEGVKPGLLGEAKLWREKTHKIFCDEFNEKKSSNKDAWKNLLDFIGHKTDDSKLFVLSKVN